LRHARSLAGILLLVVCSVSAFAQSVAGDLSPAEDPRLARTVTLSLASGTAGDALKNLSALTAVTFRISDRAAEDQGVRLALNDVSLADALTQMAALFGWRWQRTVQDEEIVYRIASAGMSGKGDPEMLRRMLEAAVREESDKQWKQAEPVLTAWRAAAGDLDELKKSDPDISALLDKDPEIGYRVRELSLLPEAERRNWIEARVYALLQRDGPRAKYALVSRYVASQIPPSPEVTASEAEPAVTMKLSGETPFWTVIQGLSKQTGVSFFSDRYSRPVAVNGLDFSKAPLSKVLDDLCRQAVYSWTDADGRVRLRSRMWFYDALREPPKAVLERFLSLKKQRGSLIFADLAALAAALSDDQIAGLADSEPAGKEPNLIAEGRNILNALNEFRLYNALNRRDALAAEGPEGFPFLRMTPHQRDLFLRYAPPGLLPPENAVESALFIIPRPGASVTFKYVYGLRLSRSREVAVGLPAEAPAEAGPPETPPVEEKPAETPAGETEKGAEG